MEQINRFTKFEATLREDQIGPPESDDRMCYLFTKKKNQEWKQFEAEDANLFKAFWGYMIQALPEDINNFIKQLRAARNVPQRAAISSKATSRNDEYDRNANHDQGELELAAESSDEDDEDDKPTTGPGRAKAKGKAAKAKRDAVAVDIAEESIPTFFPFRDSHASFGNFSELKLKYSYKTATTKGKVRDPPFTVKAKERLSEGVNYCRVERKGKGNKIRKVWSVTYNEYQAKKVNEDRLEKTEGGLWNVSETSAIDVQYKRPEQFPKFITINEKFSRQLNLKNPLPISAIAVDQQSTTENMKCEMHACCGDHLRKGDTLLPAGFDITVLVPGFAKVGLYVLYDGHICCKVGHIKTLAEHVYYFVNRPCEVTTIFSSPGLALSKNWFKNVHGCFEVRFYDSFRSASEDELGAMMQVRDKIMNRPSSLGKPQRKQSDRGGSKKDGSKRRRSTSTTPSARKGTGSNKRRCRNRGDSESDEEGSDYEDSQSSDDSSDAESEKQDAGKKRK